MIGSIFDDGVIVVIQTTRLALGAGLGVDGGGIYFDDNHHRLVARHARGQIRRDLGASLHAGCRQAIERQGAGR